MLYFCDFNGHTVWAQSLSSARNGTLSPPVLMAGVPGVNGYSGGGSMAVGSTLSGPTALAVDGNASSLYIAEYGGSLIRRLDLVTGEGRGVG